MSGAEIVQMGFQYWPKDLALKMGGRIGFTHELQKVSDDQIGDYLAKAMNPLQVEDFLTGLSPEALKKVAEPSEETEMSEAVEADAYPSLSESEDSGCG